MIACNQYLRQTGAGGSVARRRRGRDRDESPRSGNWRDSRGRQTPHKSELVALIVQVMAKRCLIHGL